ncbi:hypothetical protein [Marinomonas sp. 2405UD68-3]|uniref:hypothetical protein n=1 Tax=Marinomonas sp. 2405UD68-3 TaxID=3391835 RepID=UPI0039C9B6A8
MAKNNSIPDSDTDCSPENEALERLALEWADKIIQVNMDDIGGHYWKCIFYSIHEFTNITESDGSKSVRACHEKIISQAGRKATAQERMSKVSMNWPLALIDRQTSWIGRCLNKLTLGRYRRYAWVNSFQVSILTIARKECGFSANPLYISSVLVAKENISRKSIEKMNSAMKDYITGGMVK